MCALPHGHLALGPGSGRRSLLTSSRFSSHQVATVLLPPAQCPALLTTPQRCGRASTRRHPTIGSPRRCWPARPPPATAPPSCRRRAAAEASRHQQVLPRNSEEQSLVPDLAQLVHLSEPCLLRRIVSTPETYQPPRRTSCSRPAPWMSSPADRQSRKGCRRRMAREMATAAFVLPRCRPAASLSAANARWHAAPHAQCSPATRQRAVRAPCQGPGRRPRRRRARRRALAARWSRRRREWWSGDEAAERG